MAVTILIYAQCVNSKASGDYALAAAVAKDLAQEIREQEKDIEVVLISTKHGVARFEALYGKAFNNHITLEGFSIGLFSFEAFDPVNNEVIAFIEANRCKHAPAELLKRLLSPDSKLLFVGAANKPDYQKFAFLSAISAEQPGIYQNFFPADILVDSCGFGVDRLGFPEIKAAQNLPPLTSEEILELPIGEYGFGYLQMIEPQQDYFTLSQYIKLTPYNHYVFVGNIHPHGIKKAYQLDNTMPFALKRNFLEFTIHPQLESRVMRQVTAYADSSLVVSTGVMSTIEAMLDRKLPFYQYMNNNAFFVTAFLSAVHALCLSDNALSGTLLPFIIELSVLLFAKKPLNREEMIKTKALLANSEICNHLIEKNHAVIQKANGSLAARLLSFIGRPKTTMIQTQLLEATLTLRKTNENLVPHYDTALLRAAAWGRLFELKVFLQYLPAEKFNTVDAEMLRTALHWAVINKQFDCAGALVKAGIALNNQDIQGKTPLHFAIRDQNEPMIKLLLEAGASLEIEDFAKNKPCDGASRELMSFIYQCTVPYPFQI